MSELVLSFKNDFAPGKDINLFRRRKFFPLKFIPYHCKLNIYQHSFFPRIVIPWNQFPGSVTNLQSMDSFKLAVKPTLKV